MYCLSTVVNQFYEAEILTEYVIKGNTAVLKCSIPSFVADFVKVESWVDESNNVLLSNDNIGKSQKLKNYNLPISFSRLSNQNPCLLKGTTVM